VRSAGFGWAINHAVARGRGHRCGLPQAYAAAARQLPLCPPGYHRAFDALLFASLLIADVRTAEGKLNLFVAIDRTSKFAFAELHEKATRAVFPRALVAAVPYKIQTVLTDNGTHFTTPGTVCSAAQEIKECLAKGESVPVRAHAFERACAENDIDHRLTTPKHPWTTDVIDKRFSL
jgi:hypothetical protein